MINVREIFSKFNPDASIKISDQKLISSLTDNLDFPFLVSFPRTGSHWLRMLMELYFEKPGLVRVFYYRDCKEFTCYHTHDEDLQLEGRTNVLYLYRDPVDTVYSQLNYYKEKILDEARVDFWSDLYARHLHKWLYGEKLTTKKTLITYEGLKENIVNEFRKVTAHFEEELDVEKITSVGEQVSKSSLKKKTAHDKQVVNLDSGYADTREFFRSEMGDRVRNHVLAVDSRLASCFR